jgi:SAM-dependent methyltransferase
MSRSTARYDGHAEWYDEFVKSGPMASDAVAAACRLLGPGKDRCLDVGCGTGIAFSALRDLGWSVTGVDMSADQLRVAEPVARSTGAQLQRADAAHLPYADASFPAVVSILTHTDFDDLGGVLAECARVITPRGRLVVVGLHPCFGGPMAVRGPVGPPDLQPGYRRSGWWKGATGPVRERVGVNHRPLADLLNAVVQSGFRITRIEEPAEREDYPSLIAIAATRHSE